MNYKKEDWESGPVEVSYDPSVIRKKDKKKNELSEKEYLRETADTLTGNSAYDKGFRSTNNKIKRLKQFKQGYEDGKFTTVSAAADYMAKYVPHGITYETCLKYAKELHIMILDDKKQIWLEGTKPKYILEMEKNGEFND